MRSLTSWSVWLVALMLIAVYACKSSAPREPEKPPIKRRLPPGVQEGMGTWYGGNHHGGPTASGERFDKFAMTAAHKTLPMNTRVRVTNKRNGKSVELRINDRGPYAKGRIIDVSEAAAKRLDM